MQQVVGELVVEKNDGPEPLLSRILYLQLPGQSSLNPAMIARSYKVGFFCFVLTMGIIDTTMLYHFIRDGRRHASDHR